MSTAAETLEATAATPLDVGIREHIATLTLNRPAVGNTIDLPLARALLAAVIRCDHDAAIRCVVLTGNGRLFCGGGDIGGFAAAGEAASSYISEVAGILHMAISRLMRMPKPLLVLVNGPAAGAGASLAICGDVVLAARSAHFTAAYGNVGLTSDGGMSWLLPRLVGLRKAQEIILTNRRIQAEEAERIGLVTRVVDDAEIDAEGRAQALRLCAAATGAIGAARALLLESYGAGLETQLEREARSMAAAAGGAEFREGIAAFLARRKPEFEKEVS
ncbi:enoyl-CoA hydratase/isomerase family protein [Xanthobacter tagetidis]|uniref:Enoyl-CoA hydratase n=1 Tax=Xanthobacter tagetidis TaxID=60216 RepID=A0A3L7AJ27_9HYPH|nr:enoyl-CoA hydratase-related protein [Xanthobacter tagetidis]MBB6306461.1 2-(1,2-epoxy-1,2-dihydrophenyl)acetyl-CoA isomerase [Xanthobacter tagetidis]RLP79710.1 enoyl-CoA hydratase [Xanthobacter tagetidis]